MTEPRPPDPWPDLFTYPQAPGHRGRDTSVEAADAIAPAARNLRDAVLAFLGQQPASVHQVALELRLPVSSVQPRFSELAALGLIEDSDQRVVNASSGRKAIVWRVVPPSPAQ